MVSKTVDNILSKVENEKTMKELDKMSYTLGLFVFNITAMLIFFPNPNLLKNWIFLCMLTLALYRFVYFRTAGYHYYLFDYAYVASVFY